ncbi:MAG: hypothetical protein KJZ93_03700 [Caldilineaceae bacterium]|nr:hypothetical protein [Caldilineaceae bacterium]
MSEQLIQAQVTTTSALHVGGKDTSPISDDLLRRDAHGHLLIPGSAIAGPLRTLATRLAPRLYGESCYALDGKQRQSSEAEQPRACECPVCTLFGSFNPQEGNAEGGGCASPLWVYDAYLSGSTAIRDGVGIDRATGAAARAGSVKFDLEVLPAGATFTIRLLLQTNKVAKIQARNEQLLAVLLEEWRAGRGALGGRVARGMGALRITEPVWYRRNLGDHTALMKYLRRSDGDFFAATDELADHQQKLLNAVRQLELHPAPSIPDPRAKPQNQLGAGGNGDGENTDWTPYAVARCWLQAKITLSFSGPVLIGDATQSRRSGYDHAPLAALPITRSRKGEQQHWVLPGAGVRGVLRSQAERIARTMTTQQAWAKPDGERRSYFLAHNPAGDPNVRNPQKPLANSDALLTAAGIDGETLIKPHQVDLADQLFGSVRLGSRLLIEDGVLANRPALKPLDFLAIDRFTGGGRDSAKFDAVALWRPAFTVRLRLETPQEWELGWLLLTLRDLHDGLATIGFGAAKGFGAVKITNWRAALGFLAEEDFPSRKAEAQRLLSVIAQPTDGVWRVAALAAQEMDARQLWLPIAEEWVRAFGKKIDDFVRDDQAGKISVPPQQDDDTYFGKLEQLYPVKE